MLNYMSSKHLSTMFCKLFNSLLLSLFIKKGINKHTKKKQKNKITAQTVIVLAIFTFFFFFLSNQVSLLLYSFACNSILFQAFFHVRVRVIFQKKILSCHPPLLNLTMNSILFYLFLAVLGFCWDWESFTCMSISITYCL